MNQVIVNGQSYLGELVQGENTLTVEGALATGASVTKTDVQRYLEAENLGTLKNISFGGAGVSFSQVELDKEITFAFEVAELVMSNAKDVAVRKLENAEFRSGLGKM